MSQLKIYTNERNEIKALYYTDDTSLTEHVIDREAVFGNHTDPYILGYTYEITRDANGVPTGAISTPYVDKHYLEIVEQAVWEASGQKTIIINHSTLDDLIKFHRKAVGDVGSALIEKGIDVGNKHYSLTLNDQTKITNLYNAVKFDGKKTVAWHNDGGICTLMTADEMIQLGLMATAYVSYHLTRINMLNVMISECKTKKKVLAINYKTPLDAERSASFETLMTAMEITGDIRKYCDASVDAAGEVEGEIYSTSGCLIKPESWSTQPFCSFDGGTATTNSKTDITTFKIPVKFIDRDKLGDGKNSYNLSVIVNKLTKDGEVVKEELTNDFIMKYVYVEEDDTAYLELEMANDNVVSVLVPVASAYNELTDRVNAAETCYLIKTPTAKMVTVDYTKVMDALGFVVTEPDKTV